MADSTKCGHCAKSETASGSKLKRCAKCKSAFYCSRECQTAHWKVHKKVCATLGASTMGQPVPPAAASSQNSSEAKPPTNGPLSVTIDKPFHKLNAKTWLHGRSEQDVFMLLIDSFRLMLEDDYNLEGDVTVDSLYDGSADSRVAFYHFLQQAEQRPGLLPSWWSQEKAAECMALGLSGGWSSLAKMVQKGDIQEHYGDNELPMQLRMLREQITLRGPGGQSGAAMIQMRMQMENGGGYGTRLDLNMFRRA
ncbi:hypothetical protein BGZ72_010888 [Mortierella alpina]|nr:hypothetical protein BGZ72_010888 [Mortierella alpina]